MARNHIKARLPAASSAWLNGAVRVSAAAAVLLCLALPLAASSHAAPPTRSELAQKQFARAEAMRQELEGSPQANRTKLDYGHVLDAYRAVYHGDPASSKSPEAITAVAELLAEEGRLFAERKPLVDAVGQYEFLDKQYPRSPLRLKGVLVVTEFALAMIVLVGAGLCVTSYTRARHAYLGFKPDNVLLVGLRAGLNGYNSSTVQGFYAQLEQKLTTLPGVQATALNDWFPLGFESTGWHSVTVDGYDKTPGAFTGIMTTAVSPGYFSVLDIPLLAGRDFTDRDDEKAPRVAVINEAMARLFWPGRSALGRKFREWGREITVIGVVPTGKYRFINEPPREFYYLPYRQAPNLDMNVCLRSSQDPAVLAALVQRVVHEVDPRVEIWVTLKMADYIKAAYVAPVLAARILTCLAAAALVLAAMGVYGVMAYTVNQRTNEIGLRMALGARPGQILRWILYQGGRLALIGLGLGIAAAIGLARLTASLLYDTRVDDPSIYLGASLTLIAMASLACFLPARKAARVDPLTAIRAE